MRSSFMFLLPVFALTGCATGPSLQSRMAAYIGDDSQTLVQSLGVPDQQYTVNNSQYLAYNRSYDETVADDLYFGGYQMYNGPGGGNAPSVYEHGCQTTFFLRNDRVLGFTLHGNDCS